MKGRKGYPLFPYTVWKKTRCRKGEKPSVGTYAAILPMAAVILFPFYLFVIGVFKRPSDERRFFMAPPAVWSMDNILHVMQRKGFWSALELSLTVTLISMAVILAVQPLLAYFLSRNQGKRFFRLAYYWFILGIFLPFQVVMLPLVFLCKQLGMLNVPGLIVLTIVFAFPINIFLMTGFVKSVPRSIDEAAIMDGCGPLRTFYQIILPMMKPIVVTVAVLSTLTIWNDSTIARMLLWREKTLPLYVTSSFATCALMMILPLAVYLFGQKYMTKGLSAGALKD